MQNARLGLSCFVLGMIVSVLTTNGCGTGTIVQEGTRKSMQKESLENLEQIEKCIREFIRGIRENRDYMEINLDEDSLLGPRRRYRENVWILGEWGIKKTNDELIAYISESITDVESLVLLLKIHRVGDGYRVYDWAEERRTEFD